MLLALFAVVMRQRRRLDRDSGRRLVNLAWRHGVMLFAQVLLGAVNVWAGEHAWLIVAHLAVRRAACGCRWSLFAIRLTAVPEVSPAGARRRKSVERGGEPRGRRAG